MRLWHEDMIPYLSRQHILAQHRECCALRGKGWGKKHSTVDYVFKHPYFFLYNYHLLVMNEMKKRGYKPDEIWYNLSYRGKTLGFDNEVLKEEYIPFSHDIYPEHDNKYLLECIENLKNKGFEFRMEE